jgi:hypothetical protein
VVALLLAGAAVRAYEIRTAELQLVACHHYARW